MRLGRVAALVVPAVAVAMATGLAGHGPQATPAGATASAAVAPVAAASPVAAPNGVDVLYARMMVVHHAQAVELSRILITKPGVPERIRHIAEFIVQNQQREINETNAWLVAWDRPPADPADRQLHGGGDPAAHGMLSGSQLDQVRAAPPAEASKLFLRQMIAHHTGAITMSRSVLESDGNAYIRTLATHVINEQSAENDAMRALLAKPPPLTG